MRCNINNVQELSPVFGRVYLVKESNPDPSNETYLTEYLVLATKCKLVVLSVINPKRDHYKVGSELGEDELIFIREINAPMIVEGG